MSAIHKYQASIQKHSSLSKPTGWSYCNCGRRLETPSEYVAEICQWCEDEELNRG